MNTFLGILIPFAGTTLGAACVFFLKNEIKPLVQKMLLGFASGVMIAASVWSLLIPSMDMSEHMGKLAFIPAAVGFGLGILFLLAMDRLIPHLHLGCSEPEGKKCSLKKNTMLVLAVTLHNIPEGMAVGVVFAGMLAQNSDISMMGLYYGNPLRNRGAYRSAFDNTSGFLYHTGSSVSAVFCSRCHGIRGGGGADP